MFVWRVWFGLLYESVWIKLWNLWPHEGLVSQYSSFADSGHGVKKNHVIKETFTSENFAIKFKISEYSEDVQFIKFERSTFTHDTANSHSATHLARFCESVSVWPSLRGLDHAIWSEVRLWELHTVSQISEVTHCSACLHAAKCHVPHFRKKICSQVSLLLCYSLNCSQEVQQSNHPE
jgi:hypothetical protein